MNNMLNTSDIKNIFIDKFKNSEFRIIGNDKTVEIQNAHFIVDKPYILREPNYDYVKRELEWYKSMSRKVDDIGEPVPKIWKSVADNNGMINSNYGWCIWSFDNYNQFDNCINRLIEDKHSRQACMIYNRPSMQYDRNANGMHDFMCTYSVQLFINERDGKDRLDYIVYMRSNDAVFGFNNDALWHMHVMDKAVKYLKPTYPDIEVGNLYWNAGSLHVYERHFKFLEN